MKKRHLSNEELQRFIDEVRKVYVTAVKDCPNEVLRFECSTQTEAFSVARLLFENGYSVCIKKSSR